MAYALKRRETVQQSVRRIAAELLDQAVRDLSEETPQRAHHRVRKGCKKIRALLRLVRGPIGNTVFAQENRWYRDFARRLSGVRDSQAVVESWADVAQAVSPGDLRGIPDSRITRALVERRDRLSAQISPSPERLIDDLVEARERVGGWHLDRDGFDAIDEGLRAGFRRARSTQERAASRPTAARVHEWRKRAKDHWYHLRFIDHLWPEELHARSAALERLTTDLGRIHDLRILREALAEIALENDDNRACDRIIDNRRNALLDSALARGVHLFAEKPKSFATRIERHFELWKQGPPRSLSKNLAASRDA